MVTVEQLRELNSKIDRLKEENATAIAELKVLQGQFEAKAKSLSELLGVTITAENIEQYYNQAQQQLAEKAQRIQDLLNDLQTPAGGAAPRQMSSTNMNFGMNFGYTGNEQVPTGHPQPTSMTGLAGQMGLGAGGPIGFGAAQTMTQQQHTQLHEEQQAVAPNFANFASATTFQI